MAGQIIPADTLTAVLDPANDTLPQELIDEAFKDYHRLELSWVKQLAEGVWHDHLSTAPQAGVELEAMIEKDRTDYKASLTLNY